MVRIVAGGMIGAAVEAAAERLGERVALAHDRTPEGTAVFLDALEDAGVPVEELGLRREDALLGARVEQARAGLGAARMPTSRDVTTIRINGAAEADLVEVDWPAREEDGGVRIDLFASVSTIGERRNTDWRAGLAERLDTAREADVICWSHGEATWRVTGRVADRSVQAERVRGAVRGVRDEIVGRTRGDVLVRASLLIVEHSPDPQRG